MLFLKFFEGPDSPQGEKTITSRGRRSVWGPFLSRINGDTRSLEKSMAEPRGEGSGGPRCPRALTREGEVRGRSRGPGGQLGKSGFSPGSQNSVQLEQPPGSLDRAAAVTNHPWPELLNLGQQCPLPPGLPDPGQEEQTPRLSLELDSPPPGQHARFSLGSLRPLWLLEPPSRGLPPPPHLHTGLPLCGNTPAPFLAIGSGQCLPRLQRRLVLLKAGWGMGLGLLF